ncbi:Phenylalanine 4-hydroxylase [Enhydrobacter aerosaccus]|uniref:Phenylalanine-4-hydroxylase n=2 Tax=Enhydrobacter aerosaccus TaxID=225324 RepID=A0A1T4TIB4_9HYPH|nr:Phenylalanine 4-hydroxylase [Enhydrobacter aerosaccus]
MDSFETLTNLRGDYAVMASDWTVAQDPARYPAEDQAVWRVLADRQTALAERHACREFVEGLRTLGIGNAIPDFETVSDRLEPLTGWRIVGVPGLIPDAAFYGHLANRRFPVTVWIRKRSEIDYLVEPDLFHDFFGHVPLLSNPVFADYMQLYGQRGIDAGPRIDQLARLYWYTVEFGLIRTPAGLKIYGAGILSSASEVRHATEDADVERLPFEARQVMRRPYEIDKLQNTYFVLDDFRQLFEAASTRLD